ncbi:MAG: methyltransferase [Verrucomicrobiales bacterium]|nr:methyltransferase [Verrucomicrobiales bacterium]
MNVEALNRGSVGSTSGVQNGKGKPSKTLLFARNFLQHPRMLGSVIPSSSFLVDQALKEVRWETARVIVEYGPGVGTFTTEILNRMRPDAVLIVFEMNPNFVKYLQSSVTDPRLRVVQGSAGEVETVLRTLGCKEVDYVISGIPFSTMPEAVRDDILSATFSVLKPGGLFVVYQFSGKVLPYLERIFGQVQKEFELLNIFPARLFFCMRKQKQGS